MKHLKFIKAICCIVTLFLFFLVSCTRNQVLIKEQSLDSELANKQTFPESQILEKNDAQKNSREKASFPEQKMISSKRDLKREWSGSLCVGSGAVNLSSPIDPDSIELIAPYGLMIDAHVTPIDHQYWSPKGSFMQAPPTDVLAPASGFVVSIQHMIEYIGDRKENFKVDDYRLILEHSCSFYTYFIHVGSLSERILSAFEKQSNGALYANVRVPVKRNEVIGKITRPVDFAVVDLTKKLSGFIKPEHYDAEPWKVHTVDPFDYFLEPLRSELLAKNPRTAQPPGGKIDHDKEGYLIGNWFAKGTNGYGGLKQENYWRGHLSFAPDAYDPNQFVVSIGDYAGKAKQFGIKKGPSPDLVNENAGIVKYSLGDYEYLVANNQSWSRWKYEGPITATMKNSPVQATLLVQLLENNIIKAEVFSKIPEEVTSFEHPVEYER